MEKHDTSLSLMQLELLKSLKYIDTEQEVLEIKQLIQNYFIKKLDESLD